MPFKSKAQRRACHAAKNPAWDCSAWERHTPKKKLSTKKRRSVSNLAAFQRKKRGLVSNAAKVKRKGPLRFDPTRTGTIRKQLILALRRRFAKLKLKVVDLILREDAFGLKAPRRLQVNAFCPTGEGGGIDPSCGKGEGSNSAEGRAGTLLERLKSLPAAAVKTIKDKAASKYQQLSERYGSKYAKAIIGAALVGVPLPLPGASFITAAPVLALAEMHRYLTANVEQELSLSSQEIEQAAQELLEELEEELKQELAAVENVFCPTGLGGGVDPTCSPGSPGALLGKLKGSGGFTYVPGSKKYQAIGKSGYAVSPYSERSQVYDGKISKEQVRKFMVKNRDLLAKEGHAVGAWRDPESGKTYLDVSIVTGSKHEAISLGKKHNQISIFNFKSGKTIPTGGTGETAHNVTGPGSNGRGDRDSFGGPGRLTMNQRWASNTDAEKVRAFQEWLKQQVQQEILEGAEDELWAEYARQALVKGVGRSFDDVKHKRFGSGEGAFYEGSRREFLQSAFRQPVMVERIKMLAGRSFDDLEGVTAEMSTRMVRHLTDGLVRGTHPLEIAKSLSADVDGIGRARAETIARTEIIRAHAEGQLASFEALGVEELGVMVEWSTAQDDAVCPLCAPLEGAVFRIEEAKGMLPRHPNCLPGDSLVLPRSQVTATSERWYDGNLIILRTASGRILSCTPNHPILTDGGWVPAHLVNESCRVVCDGGSEWEPGLIDHDNQDVPTRIEEVTAAFAEASEVSSEEVPLSSPDFHGDGREGQVAVIWSYRQLGSTEQQASGKQFLQQALIGGSEGDWIRFPRLRPLAEFVKMSYPTSASFMSSSSLPRASFDIRLAPLQSLSFALRSPLDTREGQDSLYRSSRDSIAKRNGVLGLSSKVSGNNRLSRQVSGSTNRAVLTPQDAHDDLHRDTELARQLCRGDSGPVFLDQVVSVTVEFFSGHVYNLQTEQGWYSAEGIITHNCRCAWIPANVGEDKEEQQRGKATLEKAVVRSQGREKDEDDPWGPGAPISKERPKDILNYSPALVAFSHFVQETNG